MSKRKIVAVDFDGTLCENRYPDIGPMNMDLIYDLKRRREDGDILILWTCRVDHYLTNAIGACKYYGLEFDYVNENTKEIIDLFGSDCRKIYADEYIDDRAVNPKEYNLPFKTPKNDIKISWCCSNCLYHFDGSCVSAEKREYIVDRTPTCYVSVK